MFLESKTHLLAAHDVLDGICFNRSEVLGLHCQVQHVAVEFHSARLHLDDLHVFLEDELLHVPVLDRQSIEQIDLVLGDEALADEGFLNITSNIFVAEVFPEVTLENGLFLLILLFILLNLHFLQFT